MTNDGQRTQTRLALALHARAALLRDRVRGSASSASTTSRIRNNIKVGVVGPPAQTAPLRAGLEKAAGSAFDIRPVATVAEAAHEVRQRDLTAAFVPTANPQQPATVIVASAGGRLVAAAAETLARSVTARAGSAARRARRTPAAIRGRDRARRLHVHDRLHDRRLHRRHGPRDVRSNADAAPPLSDHRGDRRR